MNCRVMPEKLPNFGECLRILNLTNLERVCILIKNEEVTLWKT